MANVKVWCRAQIEIDGIVYTIGRRHTDAPYLISVDGNVHDIQRDIGTSTTVTLFDIDQDLSDFDFLAIESDRDVMVELTVDKGGENGTEYHTIPLTGASETRPGVPFMLARDDSFANYSAGFAGGTLDLIETIKVKNRSATDTAHVRLVAVT